MTASADLFTAPIKAPDSSANSPEIVWFSADVLHPLRTYHVSNNACATVSIEIYGNDGRVRTYVELNAEQLREAARAMLDAAHHLEQQAKS